jgi:hypothetical protein
MKKHPKAKVKIREAKLKKVEKLKDDLHVVHADNVVMEVRGALPVPEEPLPSDPIIFEDNIDGKAVSAALEQSLRSPWQKWCDFWK